MPLLNAWKLEGRRLVDALGPKERVLAFTPSGLGQTEFKMLRAFEEKAADKNADSGPVWKVLGAIGGLLNPPSVKPLDKLADAVSSESVAGEDTSIARTVGRQVDAGASLVQIYLAVTDRRFLVLPGKTPEPTDPLVLVAEVDGRRCVPPRCGQICSPARSVGSGSRSWTIPGLSSPMR